MLAWVAPHPPRTPPRGCALTPFADSDAFLLETGAFDFAAYVIAAGQAGVDGIALVRLIRRHGAAGILFLDTAPPTRFCEALDSGADMVLAPDAPREHVESALAAIARRTRAAGLAPDMPWRLARFAPRLWAPSGTPITLSDGDCRLLRCFVEAGGAPVSRETLRASLWGADAASMDNALQATIYRLRKRIEAAAPDPLPIRAVARTGYEFRAPLAWD